MLLSKNLRTALGTASLLMSLVVADSSFAASAVKAAVKKAPVNNPTYSFSVNGSGSFALRHTTTGLTDTNHDGYPNSTKDDIWDMGAYGNGFFVAMNAKGQFGNLSYGTDIAFSPMEYVSGDNIVLSFRDVGISASNSVAAATTEPFIVNYLPLTLQSANVFVSHSNWGALRLGFGETMSGKASDLNYSKAGSDLGKDFATIHYTSSADTTVSSEQTPQKMFAMPRGQGKAYTMEYTMPAVVSGLDMGMSYAFADTWNNTQSVLSESMSVGLTYETTMDVAKFKAGFSAADNIGLNTILVGSAGASYAEHAWVRSGKTYGGSIAVEAKGFDANLNIQHWSPYNDRKNAAGTAQENYQEADGLKVGVGYTAQNLTGLGSTNFSIRYGSAKNAYQTVGATNNKSEATVMDVSVTQAIGNAEIYAAYTNFDAPTGTYWKDTNGDGDYTNVTSTDLALKGMSGLVAGMKFSF